MMHWMPIRKVVAAALTALIAAPAVTAYLAGGDGFDWRGTVAVVLAAVVPIVVAYLTPEKPADDEIPGGEPGDL